MRHGNKKKIIRERSRERGMILAVALMVTVVMLLMAVPFLSKMSAQYRASDRTFKSGSAFALAEAGIDRILWEMNQDYRIDGGIIWDANGQGGLNIDDLRGDDGRLAGDVGVLVSPPMGAAPQTRFIESTGIVPFVGAGTVSRTVRVNLEEYFRSIFDFGFFANDGFLASNNIQIDSYNSNNGPYGGDNMLGPQGHIGTNATGTNSFEILRGGDFTTTSSALYGNVAAGFGASEDPSVLSTVINVPSETIFKNGAERMVLSAPFEMPSVDLYNLPPRDMFNTTIDFRPWFTSAPPVSDPLPSALVNAAYNKGDYTIPKASGEVTLTSDASGVYTSFIIAKQKIVHVSGDVAIYVTGLDGNTGAFKMDVGSTLEIMPHSSLTLVLGKTTFDMQNNTFRNQTGAPANLTIMGTDQFTADMNWDNNSDTVAAIYIPRAAFVPVQGMANIDVYGALVCRYMDLKSNINLHYDQALKDLDNLRGGIPIWRITSWQERFLTGNSN